MLAFNFYESSYQLFYFVVCAFSVLRNVSSHSCGNLKSEIKASTGTILSEGSRGGSSLAYCYFLVVAGSPWQHSSIGWHKSNQNSGLQSPKAIFLSCVKCLFFILTSPSILTPSIINSKSHISSKYPKHHILSHLNQIGVISVIWSILGQNCFPSVYLEI